MIQSEGRIEATSWNGRRRLEWTDNNCVACARNTFDRMTSYNRVALLHAPHKLKMMRRATDADECKGAIDADGVGKN